MAQLSREGHRQRLKKQFENDFGESMPDYQLLELLLFYAIPRIDTKPLAYALLNRFGTLENVFNAEREALLEVDGIGENSVTLIKLFESLNLRIHENRNTGKTKINSGDEAKKFASNILKEHRNEAVLLITLKTDGEILGWHIVSKGLPSFATIDQREIVKHAINDNAVNIIIAHNHPSGNTEPSAEDMSFTLQLISMLRNVKVNVLDHVIVGRDNAVCMTEFSKYRKFFK